jgi:pantetheine-phosphate adenylyltransferase
VRAVYAGTFDPITYGHLSIVRRAQALFGSVVVLVAENPSKKPLFSVSERLELIQESLAYANISHAYPMYTKLYVAEWCSYGDVLVRGIRDAADLEGELAIAAFNRAPKIVKDNGRVAEPSGLETVWLPATSAEISSSMVKAGILAGDPAVQYAVTPVVYARVRARLGVSL